MRTERAEEIKAALIEADATTRRALRALLRDLGAGTIFAFDRPEIAFYFLLGHMHEVDIVVLNQEDGETSGLLQRLRVLPARFTTIVYSGARLGRVFRWRLHPGPVLHRRPPPAARRARSG